MYRFFLFTILIGFGLTSCSPNKKLISVDPKYKKWVAGYTYGVISNQDGFSIELRNGLDSSIIEEYDLKSATDDKILEDILEISPAIKGEIKWEDERTITFDPDETLPSGQLYTVNLNLEKLANVESGYEEFTFQFATIPQKIELGYIDVLEYDSYNTDLYYAKGTLRLTDHTEIEQVKKVLSAKYEGKSVQVKIEKGYEENEYDFKIDSLQRGMQARLLTI